MGDITSEKAEFAKVVIDKTTDVKQFVRNVMGGVRAGNERMSDVLLMDVVPFSVEIQGAAVPRGHYAIFLSVTTAASRALMS